MFKGQAAPENKIHDFHPPITPAGLYWIAPVPEGALEISGNGRSAVLELRDIAVIDQPSWPARNAPSNPARLSLRVIWKATGDSILYEDVCRHFRVEGFKATAQAEAAVEVPSLNFAWRSDPIGTSKAGFAIIGTEVNGRYYDAT